MCIFRLVFSSIKTLGYDAVCGDRERSAGDSEFSGVKNIVGSHVEGATDWFGGTSGVGKPVIVEPEAKARGSISAWWASKGVGSMVGMGVSVEGIRTWIGGVWVENPLNIDPGTSGIA